MICDNVRVALPLLVSAIGCELLLPTVTVPKLTLDELAAICGCVPVPLSEIESEVFDALLDIDRLPVTCPAPVGAKFTEIVTD